MSADTQVKEPTPSKPSSCTYTAGDEEKNVACKGIWNLWEHRLLCDVHLVTEGQTFPVHRCILASCSEYFTNMFTKGFKESTEEQVEIKAVTAKGLEAILLYMYTGKIEINLDNFEFILAASCHMQILDVQKFCTRFMKQMLSADTCVEFFRLSNLYALDNLQKNIKVFMLNNCALIFQSEQFTEMPLDLLCELLADDMLKVESELLVFKNTIRWLQADPERHNHGEKVLKLIRYGLMTAGEMQVVYGHDENDIMMQPSCRKLLRDALDYHINVFQQPIKEAAKAYPRSYVNSLLVVGGSLHVAKNIVNHSVFACRIQKSQLKRYEHIGMFKPKEARSDAAVALLNNFLFVAGGEAEVDRRTSRPTSSVFRYNPRDGKWLQIASMNTARKCFALVALSDKLFATGGACEKNQRILDSTETYSFAVNEWSYATDLRPPRYDHAGCAHKNLCYVSGGNHDLGVTPILQFYDPKKEKWINKSRLHQARACHVMVSHEDTLLVCGGRIKKEDGSNVFATHVEMYDLQQDQWTIVTQMPDKVCKPAVACFETFVFILGGTDEYNNKSRDIQCYDTAKDKWIAQYNRQLPRDNMEGMLAGYVRLAPKFGDRLPTTNNMYL